MARWEDLSDDEDLLDLLEALLIASDPAETQKAAAGLQMFLDERLDARPSVDWPRQYPWDMAGKKRAS